MRQMVAGLRQPYRPLLLAVFRLVPSSLRANGYTAALAARIVQALRRPGAARPGANGSSVATNLSARTLGDSLGSLLDENMVGAAGLEPATR